MTNGADLLRMLEPAVRPVSVPGAPPARPGAAPVEQRGFESLLSDAAASGGSGGSGAPAAAAAPPPAARHPLAGIDRIENGALRQLIAAQASPAAASSFPGAP